MNEVDTKLVYEGLWEVESQYLKLRFWERDFKPEEQNSSSAFVWMLFPGLSIEYWHEDILMAMGRAIGRPICIDSTTLKKEVGYYASILVEIYITKTIPNKVVVESKHCKFEQEIRLSKLPKFYSKCKVMGHLVSECRIARREQNHDVKIRKPQWRYTPKKTTTQQTGGFDICFPSCSNLENGKNCEDDDVVVVVPPIQNNTPTLNKEKGFTGLLESPNDFRSLFVDKLIDVGANNNISHTTETTISERWKEVPGSIAKFKNVHNNINSEPKIKVSSSALKSLNLSGMSKMVGDVMVTGIHATCLTVDRRDLWEELFNTSQTDWPWMMIGDFNVVLIYEEKIGGRKPLRISMQEFRNCLESCNLIQAARTGIKYSWCNNRAGVRGTSDHEPLFGSTVNICKPTNSPFRYQNIWTSHPGFLDVIKDAWNESISGNQAFSFMNKLKRVKQILKKWNWEDFGDLRIKMKTNEDEVLAATLFSDADPENTELLNNLDTTRGKQEIVSKQYNDLMRDKARINWVKKGGTNTDFFHASIKIRQSHNNITKMENTEGNVITDQAQIATILVDHFTKKFEYQNVTIHEEIMEEIPKILTEEDNNFLDVVPTAIEIKEAVFSMNAKSAPGSDGFPDSFYKFARSIISAELIETIQYCWSHKFIPIGLNSNFLFILPKSQGARRAEQFRPIGLENFIFKIFTKIITTRISSLI
ncbi:uncharacterized protein LOC113305686 [Papaver somniferum]|uniref:uncharacterized protein LOC113305686 n=1 Tax=Papaver somniferum TaxID=3469 RepID=UPI000E6FB760|nr:uncharacterized protein LOC113305686 [Papaver somniferum]